MGIIKAVATGVFVRHEASQALRAREQERGKEARKTLAYKKRLENPSPTFFDWLSSFQDSKLARKERRLELRRYEADLLAYELDLAERRAQLLAQPIQETPALPQAVAEPPKPKTYDEMTLQELEKCLFDLDDHGDPIPQELVAEYFKKKGAQGKKR